MWGKLRVHVIVSLEADTRLWLSWSSHSAGPCMAFITELLLSTRQLGWDLYSYTKGFMNGLLWTNSSPEATMAPLDYPSILFGIIFLPFGSELGLRWDVQKLSRELQSIPLLHSWEFSNLSIFFLFFHFNIIWSLSKVRVETMSQRFLYTFLFKNYLRIGNVFAKVKILRWKHIDRFTCTLSCASSISPIFLAQDLKIFTEF